MRFLVTGAAGFIGSSLVDRLLAGGHEVVGVDNFDPFYPAPVKERFLEDARGSERFRLVEADIRDMEALERELPGGAEGGAGGDGDPVDVVIHLAARAGVRPSIEDPVLYEQVNVGGTQNLLEWARRRDVGRFVFGSSSSVYGSREAVPFSEGDRVDEPISPYAATKRAGELLCHTCHHLFGMGILALRFFTVYGPRQRPDLAIHKFTRLLARGEPIPRFGDGSSSRDYTYIDDVLDGVVGAVDYLEEHPDAFEIVNLGESETVRLSRLIEVIGEAMEVEPGIRQLPERPGDVPRTYADVSKARRLLGYDPSVSIEEGVARFVDWFEENRELLLEVEAG